jgi:hypothetical protein
MTTTQASKTVTRSRAASWALFVIDAALLITSGAIHLHLWDIAYRHVATLGPLFLVQGIVAILMGLAILVTRNILLVAAGAALCIGTIGGFILADTVGIFGFKLPYITTEAWTVLVVEIVAIIALAVTAAMLLRRRAAS